MRHVRRDNPERQAAPCDRAAGACVAGRAEHPARAWRGAKACLLMLLLSGCAGVNELWNQPLWTASGIDACVPLQTWPNPLQQELSQLWDRPIFQPILVPFPECVSDVWMQTLRIVPTPYVDGCELTPGQVFEQRFSEVWYRPLIDPSSPRLAERAREVWNRPFFWGTQPPPLDIDPIPYRSWASEIDYPDVETPPPPAEMFLAEPRRLRNLEKDEIWDMPLEQAIRIALSHSDIIRTSGQFLSPANPLLNNPEFVPSALDPAIQESGVLFGQRGVEAALSEFDAQFTTSMIWGRDERIQNTAVGTGVPPGSTLAQETGNFSTGLTKRLATGGIIGVIHDWNYVGSNANEFSALPGPLLFPSSYTGRVRVEARQPLWAGAGTEYTRIAGPITEQIQGVTGVQQGVVIARINNDIELTEFEAAIRDLLRDVETLYWQLYLAYQRFDSEMSLLAEAVDSYRNVETLVRSESPYAGALEEADAMEFVYQMQARVDQARSNLYDVEAQLRRMMGLTVNDGKVIRPLSEPTLAEFVPDWQMTLGEALASRVELRRQKWSVKQLELQLRAAEHLVKPRLDFVAAYQVNGFGDDLLGNTNAGMMQPGLGNAYATITRGDQTGWNLGFELSVPLGLRFAHAQVRNLELRLAKARAVLGEAEIEIGHELADTFRELDRTYLAMRTNLNRKRTAQRRVEAVEALHQRQPEQYTEEAILRARDQLNQIEQAYLQTLVEYNVAIMELHYRAGKLLDLNSVQLSEGPWNAGAEYDVLDRGYDRWHSLPTATMLHTEPEEFSYPGAIVLPGPPLEAVGPAMREWSRTTPPGALPPMLRTSEANIRGVEPTPAGFPPARE